MEKITLGEMKDIIKEEKILPSDLFGIESLTGDPLMRGFVDSAVKETQGKLRGEAEQRRRGEEGLDKKAEEWKTKEEEKDKKIKELEIKNAKRDATDLFAKKIKERKLDKQQGQFIEKKQNGFEPDDLEKLDKEVDVFMDDKIEEFKETAKIFGIKTKEVKEGDEEETTGSPPGNEEEQEENSLIPD